MISSPLKIKCQDISKPVSIPVSVAYSTLSSNFLYTLQYPAVPCSTLQYTPAVPTVPSTLQYPQYPQYPAVPTGTAAVPNCHFSRCSTHSTHSTLQYPWVLWVLYSTCSTHSTLQYPSAVPTVPGLPQYPRVLCSTRQGNHDGFDDVYPSACAWSMLRKIFWEQLS